MRISKSSVLALAAIAFTMGAGETSGLGDNAAIAARLHSRCHYGRRALSDHHRENDAARFAARDRRGAGSERSKGRYRMAELFRA